MENQTHKKSVEQTDDLRAENKSLISENNELKRIIIEHQKYLAVMMKEKNKIKNQITFNKNKLKQYIELSKAEIEKLNAKITNLEYAEET